MFFRCRITFGLLLFLNICFMTPNRYVLTIWVQWFQVTKCWDMIWLFCKRAICYLHIVLSLIVMHGSTDFFMALLYHFVHYIGLNAFSCLHCPCYNPVTGHYWVIGCFLKILNTMESILDSPLFWDINRVPLAEIILEVILAEIIVEDILCHGMLVLVLTSNCQLPLKFQIVKTKSELILKKN